MRYSWTTLQVRDLEKSIHFYETIVGLSVNRRFKAGSSMEIAFLCHEEGDTEIELMAGNDPAQIAHGQSISMGFVAEDLQEVMAALDRCSYSYNKEIFSPNPNIQFFYATDPDGVKIQFIQNLK